MANKVSMLCNFSVTLYSRLFLLLATSDPISQFRANFRVAEIQRQRVHTTSMATVSRRERKECSVSYQVCGKSKSAQIHRNPNLTALTVHGAAYTLYLLTFIPGKPAGP